MLPVLLRGMSKPLRSSLPLSPRASDNIPVGVGESLLINLDRFKKWPSVKAREWTERFITVVCAQHSTEAIVFLGSLVRPVNEVSDVDILYIFKDTYHEYSGRPLDVDLRTYSAEQVPHLIAQAHDLLGWALKFGCLVCEKDRYWTLIRKEWLNKLPYPSPKTARQRALRAEKLYLELREMGDLDAAREQLVSYLTHVGRERLLLAGIYPKSRPELPQQLRTIGESDLSNRLEKALCERAAAFLPTA